MDISKIHGNLFRIASSYNYLINIGISLVPKIHKERETD